MAIGSGLGSQVGFVNESVYGTFVAPTKFTRAKTYTANREQERPQGMGIASGNFGALGAHYVETTTGGSGAMTFDLQSKGLGLLLQAITGGTSVSALTSTPAYTQTHTLGDNYGKSLTLQVGAPYRTGAAASHTILGAKVTSAEFTCAVNEIASATVNFDAKTFDDAQVLATASYLSTNVFHGKQMAVKLGTYSSEAAITGVTQWAQTWTRAMDTNDYTAGASGLKSEPVLNGNYEISGSLTVDWLSKTTIQDLMIANTPKSLVVEFVGPVITSTYYETLRFTLPSVYFSGDIQGVSGPDTLSNQWNYTWKYDGTNLPKIELITTDSAL